MTVVFTLLMWLFTTLLEDGVGEFKHLGKSKAHVVDSDDEEEDEKPAEEITHAKQDRLCAVIGKQYVNVIPCLVVLLTRCLHPSRSLATA